MSTTNEWVASWFEEHPSAHVMLSMVGGATCLGINRQARALLGFHEQPHDGAAHFDALSRAQEGTAWGEALTRVSASQTPVTTILRGGDGRHWELELCRVGGNVMGTLVGQVGARISLHHAGLDLLRLLINTLTNPIFVKDRQHRWILANQAFADLLGHELESLLGRSDPDIFPKDQADVFWEKDDEVFAGGVLVGNEEALTDALGKTFWIYTQKTPVTLPDGTEALVGIITDITARKNAEEALLKSIAARDRAVEETQAKNRFMAKVSHELRTPLTSILGGAELLLEEGALPEGARRDVEHILDAGKRLFSLITDVLDMTHLEAGTVQRQLEEFALRPLLESFSDRLPAREEGANTLRIECPPSLMLWSDRARVAQILEHLWSNAEKFTDGGVITFRAQAQEGGVVLEVRDTGRGIPKEAQPHIFDVFSQSHQGDALLLQGTGLGLAIVRGLAALLDAQLSLESEPGVGTCVRLVFPARGSGV